MLSESILTSVKKLLGISEEMKAFDLDIMLNLNAAIATLRQIGIGPKEGYTVTSKDETYEDYLGEDYPETAQVKMYLFYKTKLGFDPPQSSIAVELIKEMIKETEWRLYVSVNPEDTFEVEEDV